MDALNFIFPIIIFTGFLLIFFFVWAAKNGQFEDLETQKYRIFFEEE